MKQLILLFIYFTIHGVKAQNVGIGTTTPAYPLTVIPDNNGNGIVQESNTVKIGFQTNAVLGGVLKTLTNHPLFFSTNNNGVATMMIAPDKNVGIGLGVNLPAYKLDLGGRMRLQHNTANNQTAGAWLDGPFIEASSFIGVINDDHVGIWGSGGAGWNIAMNVENGNTGIGISTPTAKLDINGSLRLRSSYPKKGSVLISTDNDGNAVWQTPVAFHASGTMVDSFVIPGATWTRFLFAPTVEYNSGLHYQINASQFVAPVKGIYHFAGCISLFNERTANQGIALKRTRSGITTNIEYQMQNHGGVTVSGTQYTNTAATDMSFSTDVLLEAGDIIWVEVYNGANTYTNNYPGLHWFTGNLVARL